MIRFDHFNFNVMDLEKSIQFYKEAFGLEQIRSIDGPEGSFKIVYLADQETSFRLELTWLRDRKEPYNLGDLEYHLAFKTDQFDEFHKKHQEMGIICFENDAMGIYFVSDPDGYWIEVVPVRE
ncbi:MAG: VOC family protein [Clostridiales bacterium]|nr:VOC family protein [Clostridiales bacterium]